MMTTTIPIIAGAFALLNDPEDPRNDIVLTLCGSIIILIALASVGIEVGTIGETIKTAFIVLIGYYFGKKESEVLP